MSVSPRVLWRRARIGGGVVLSLAVIGLFFWLFAVNWRPAVKDFPIQGIDISERSGTIDWWRVKSGGTVDFVYARATTGAIGRDRRFEQYWKGVFVTDIPHGAIHVFSLCRLAADQAGNFAAAVPARPDLLPMALELDFEPRCAARPSRDVVLGEISRFLTAVEAYTGKRAILKITQRFDAYYRVTSAIQRPLWAVQPFFPPSYFDKRWTIWQSSSFRRVEGVANPVNWDVMAQ